MVNRITFSALIDRAPDLSIMYNMLLLRSVGQTAPGLRFDLICYRSDQWVDQRLKCHSIERVTAQIIGPINQRPKRCSIHMPLHRSAGKSNQRPKMLFDLRFRCSQSKKKSSHALKGCIESSPGGKRGAEGSVELPPSLFSLDSNSLDRHAVSPPCPSLQERDIQRRLSPEPDLQGRPVVFLTKRSRLLSGDFELVEPRDRRMTFPYS